MPHLSSTLALLVGALAAPSAAASTRKILALHGGGGTAAGFGNNFPLSNEALGGEHEYEFFFASAPDGGLWMRDPPGGKNVATTDPDWASESISTLNQIVEEEGINIEINII